MLMGAPTAPALSTAQYELTALSDITLQGINDAIVNGFGGKLGPTDPYYPGVFNNDTTVTGIYGAAYYVLDQSGIVPLNLDRYFFEAGSKASNPLTGGLGAVAYVGLTSVLGANSLPAQLAKAVFVTGTMNIQDAVVALTAGIPVLGELTSVYVNGTVAGGTTNYGTGFAGVSAYIQATYPGIASLVGSLDFGKIGFGGRDESDDDNEDDSDSEDSEDDHSSSGSNSSNGNGRRGGDDRVAAPAASAAAIAVSLPRPAAATSQVASVPALASVSVSGNAQRTPAAAVVSPKRASARGASAASVARPNAGAARSARAAAATR